MKRIIILIIATLIVINGYSKSISAKCYFENTYNYGDIGDGWYRANVRYTNYSTGTNATYSLKVYVEYGRVTKIDFGNGGSVHSGYNNEGYFYSGGNLNYDTDYNGNIVAATATVTISDDNGMRYFKIIIE